MPLSALPRTRAFSPCRAPNGCEATALLQQAQRGARIENLRGGSPSGLAGHSTCGITLALNRNKMKKFGRPEGLPPQKPPQLTVRQNGPSIGSQLTGSCRLQQIQSRDQIGPHGEPAVCGTQLEQPSPIATDNHIGRSTS